MWRFHLLWILYFLASLCSAEVYYVTPSSSTPCPKDGSQCLTLSDYADKPNSYFSSVTTLIFLPGNHSMKANLSLEHLQNVSLVSYNITSRELIAVTCVTDQSVSLIFSNINSVYISSISFLGCGGNNAVSVKNFTLEDCRLMGSGTNGSGFVLRNVSAANIVRSRFELHTGSPELVYWKVKKLFIHGYVGGALIIDHSNASIVNSSFYRNTANFGGALYAVSNSVVTIESCIFANNRAHPTNPYDPGFFNGGAIFTTNCTVEIKYAQFLNNTAAGYGGVLFNDDGHALIMSNSVFNNNSATDGSGGALDLNIFSNVVINECTFTNNTATRVIGDGGAINIAPSEPSSEPCTVMIKSSHFSQNSAVFSGGGGIRVYPYCSNVTITNNNFTYNSATQGGAMKLSGSLDYLISDVYIYGNTASDVGGGIYVGDSGNATIVHSTFSSNYAGLGGALISTFSRVSLTDTTFDHNNATKGAAFSHFSGKDEPTLTTSGFLIIRDNTAEYSVVHVSSSTATFSGDLTFERNSGSFYAVYSNVSFAGYSNFTNNSIFIGNPYYNDQKVLDRQEGGALTLLQSNVIISGVSNFLFNSAHFGGSILISQSTLHVYGPMTIAYNNASSSGGGLYVYQSTVYCMESINITENSASQGGGMYGSSATLVLMQKMKFAQNQAVFGGGIYLSFNSIIDLLKVEIECLYNTFDRDMWLNLTFSGNVAKSGADVYVDDSTISGTCSAKNPQGTIFERECFLQSSALYLDIVTDLTHGNCGGGPIHTENVYFLSSMNSSSRIHGGLLDRCKIGPLSEIYVVKNGSPNVSSVSALLSISNIQAHDIQHVISSDPVRICFCLNETNSVKPDCSFKPTAFSVRKGELFNVWLVAVDQVNNTIPAVIRSSLSSGEGGLSEGQAIQNTTNTCTLLNYTISSPYKSERVYLYAEGPCKDLGISQQLIDVMFQNCPVGFEEGETGKCQCASEISQSVTNCSIDSETILTKENIWVGYDNQSGYIAHQCSYDYCKLDSTHLNLNTPNGSDTQCAFDRSGLLCGACKAGLSLSLGSSRCTHCSNYWILLLVPFAIAGVLLVILLLLCNLTVAVGTVNGLIFYANIVEANKAIFYPATSANPLTVFISWINLDLGIETCFYNGMTAYDRTWLQLVFPLYIIFLVILIIQISKCSSKFSRLLTNNPVAILATLILLSYTKLLQAVITTLSVTEIKSTNDSMTINYKRVWLIDPTIEYLKGKHIPLFITGIVLLLVGLVYTFLLVSWQWLHPILTKFRYFRTSTLIRSTNHFMDAYHAPYKPRHRYWAGLLLLVRAILYLISAVNVFGDPQVNLASIIFVISGLLLFQIGMNNIYKNWILNLLESTFFFNLTLLATTILSFKSAGEESSHSFVAYISIGVALASFIAILFYHFYEFFLKGVYFHLKGERRRYDYLQNDTKTVNSELHSATREPLDLIDEDPSPEDYRQAVPIAEQTSDKKKLGVTYTEVVVDDLS